MAPAASHSPDHLLREARLHLGHLMAQAEIALPGAAHDDRLALTILVREAIRSGTLLQQGACRHWKLHLEEISYDGLAIGSWKIHIKITRKKERHIGLERRNTLIQDGMEIENTIRLIGDVVQKDKRETCGAEGMESAAAIAQPPVAEFALVRLARGFPEGLKCRIDDSHGFSASVKLRKIQSGPELLSSFLFKISKLKDFFPNSRFFSSG